MAELAIRGMTVDEFLRWEDGTDTRYELIGGFVYVMAPPARAHGRLAVRLGGAINTALRSRPTCFVQSKGGVVRPDSDDTCYIADLVASCEPSEPGDQLLRAPFLIVEILSPSTTSFDRSQKVADYRRIGSVDEILLIESEMIFAEILRREGDRWITEIVQGPGAMLSLSSVPLSLPMAELYEGIPLPEPRAAAGPPR
ncbi:MAG TPA: Uma2 family endonuclease [Stellaceae bacterium]|jgi:Uma2 family endonuclease|nr:Uma2 family endonuclease [Stellaceae bacterium]